MKFIEYILAIRATFTFLDKTSGIAITPVDLARFYEQNNGFL